MLDLSRLPNGDGAAIDAKLGRYGQHGLGRKFASKTSRALIVSDPGSERERAIDNNSARSSSPSLKPPFTECSSRARIVSVNLRGGTLARAGAPYSRSCMEEVVTLHRLS